MKNTTTAASPLATQPTFPFDEIDNDTVGGRYLRKFWQPIHLSESLKPKQGKTLKIMGEEYVLYRGEGGEAHISAARCPHRGVPLSVGWVEGDSIRCLYHGWKFDAGGQCTEQPGSANPVGASKIQIESYPVREYLGLIFGYFSSDEPPPLPTYPVMEREGCLDPQTYIRECNYFQSIENGLDEIHVAFTHANTGFSTSGLNNELPIVKAERTSYGAVQFGYRGEKVRKTHFLMPNVLFLKLPPGLPGESEWRDYVSWRVPIDRYSHVSFLVQRLSVTEEHFSAYRKTRQKELDELADQPSANEISKRILRGELAIADVLHRPDLVTIQDNVTQTGQGVIADRKAERLALSDAGIVHIRRLWQQEMAALVEGRPLTKWEFPADLASTSGL